MAPVQLGCCPDLPRCLLCPPAPPRTDPGTIVALRAHYAKERSQPGDDVHVAFFGGAVPDDDQLEAAGPGFTVRVRPDLLSRADLERLCDAGCAGVELDALTFHSPILKACGRRYREHLVRQIVEGVRSAGLEAGIVLAPGLPGSSHDLSVMDAHTAVELEFATARLHPVLVRDGSRLREAHMDGQYEPLTVAQAVTACDAMMEVLEAGDVRVIRVGQNAGGDELGSVVAGPRHSSLRELVEARRSLRELRPLFQPGHRGRRVVIQCAPADISRVRGPFNQNVRTLRADYGLAELRVIGVSDLPRGHYKLAFLR